MNLVPLLLVLALAANPELKRARDRFEFGAYADAAGTLRQLLAGDPDLTEAEFVEAYRVLGIAEYHLGDLAQARAAFVNLLSHEPDFSLDPFLVPPAIVEFFDRVKKEHEAALVPLRERKRALEAERRLAEEAKRKLLAEELVRSGPPARVVRIERHHYFFNWLPLGAGQFQNGENGKGTAIAAGQLVLGAVNLAAIVTHDRVARDRKGCVTGQPGCSRPPYTNADRRLLRQIETAKYVSAGMFWALYGYGVWDAHRHYVPVVETEITPGGRGAALKLSWQF